MDFVAEISSLTFFCKKCRPGIGRFAATVAASVLEQLEAVFAVFSRKIGWRFTKRVVTFPTSGALFDCEVINGAANENFQLPEGPTADEPNAERR